MKRLLTILIVLLSAMTIYGQDLIVTTAKDSLNCKVTKVDQDNIYYKINGRDEVIELIRVKACLYDYYKQRPPVVVPQEDEAGQAVSEVKDEEGYYRKFRFSLGGGAGYRTYGIGDGVTTVLYDYYSKLKLGYYIGGDATYFFSQTKGAGLKFSLYKSSNAIDDTWVLINGALSQGRYSDDITLIYAGPSYTNKLLSQGNRNTLLFTVSLGYMYYENDMSRDGNYNLTGNCVGFSITLDYDVPVSDYFSLGIQSSIVNGSLTKISQTDPSGLVSTYYWGEGLTRVNLGLTLVF